MTRNEKIVKLLHFKGVINNKHINIKLCDEKKDSSFTIQTVDKVKFVNSL